MPLNPNLRKRNSRGFSLLELLLAAGLIPLVSFVVFSNITSGMRLWRAINQSIVEEDLLLFRQKVSSDFDRAFKFSPIPFTGDSGRVSFAALMDVPAELGGDRGIGQVSFFYDDSKKAVMKEDADLSLLFKGSSARARALMQGVRAFRVQYFSYEALQDEYAWKEEWDASEKFLPIAVRFTCQTEKTGEPRVFTFVIPSGG